MHNEKKTRRQTKKGLTRELICFCVLKLPSCASLVELTAKISQAQEDTDKERKQIRKEGRKEGKRRKKGKVKERRKEGRKKQVYKKKSRRSNNEKGPAQELILLPLY